MHRFDRPGFRQIMLMPGPSCAFDDYDLSIGTLGYLESLNGFDWSQVAQRISLHFITHGAGDVIHQNQRYSLSAGDAFCFFPDQCYHYKDYHGQPWRYTWLSLHGHQAAALCQQLGFHPDNPVQRSMSINAIQHVIREIDSAFRSEDHSEFFPQSAAWQLIDHLQSQQRVRSNTAHEQLAQVLKRILDEEYAQADISITQIAQDLQVDRSTLFRHFQARYDIAPKAYLEQQRMRHAQALLRGHHLQIKEIAQHCGYEDPQYFSRAFRKHAGVAPSAYAKKNPHN